MPQFDEFEIRMLEAFSATDASRSRNWRRRSACRRRPAPAASTRCRKPASSRAFQAVIGRRAVGLMVEVFIQVRLISHSDGSPETFIAAVERMDEVSACWTMTGEHDFLLHVMVPSVDDLNDFVMHRLMRLKGVRDVHTQLVLQNIKGPGARRSAISGDRSFSSVFLRKCCTETAEPSQLQV